MEDNNPSSTQAPIAQPTGQSAIAPAGEGQEKVSSSVGSPESLDLKKIGETLGTEFKSTEEALKSIQNLKSFVGDQTIAEQRKAAERYEKVSRRLAPEAYEKGFQTPDEYIDYLLDTSGNTNVASPTVNEADSWRRTREETAKKEQENKTISELQEKLHRIEFKETIGQDALKYYDAVKSYAQAHGLKDLKYAYEKSGFKDLVEADKNRTATSVIENSRVSQDVGKDYERDLEEAQRTKNWAPFLAKYKGFESPK